MKVSSNPEGEQVAPIDMCGKSTTHAHNMAIQAQASLILRVQTSRIHLSTSVNQVTPVEASASQCNLGVSQCKLGVNQCQPV
eukprot:6329186-Pyramimonas_sp.AAC.1